MRARALSSTRNAVISSGSDGEEEYIIYTAPVGTIRDEDLTEENAFYQFVEDEGL